jgi:hypothetical protein
MERITTIDAWKKFKLNEEYTINSDNIAKIIFDFERNHSGTEEVPDEEFVELANQIISDAGLTDMLDVTRINDLAQYLDDNWNGNKIGAPIKDIASKIQPEYQG